MKFLHKYAVSTGSVPRSTLKNYGLLDDILQKPKGWLALGKSFRWGKNSFSSKCDFATIYL